MLVCVFLCAVCTRDRGCGAHPVFPAPSFLVGGKFQNKNSRGTRGEIVRSCLKLTTVIASEAKQSIVPQKGRMDCFASLAMTMLDHHRFTYSDRFVILG